MDERLERSYALCHRIARTQARNFYYPFLIFPAEKRRALYAVYSFMRHCDDVSDGTGREQDKGRRLSQWRSLLEKTAPRPDENPILPAFHDTLERFSIPRRYFHEILDGVETDLWQNRYADFQDLYRYCYRVASAVGLVCIHIFGYNSPEAFRRAEFCGVAFQLTNILRDLKEDAQRDRIYLPQEDLANFLYPEKDLLEGVYDHRFRKLMKFQVDRAREYYRRAQPLLEMVDPRSRAGLAAMMKVYGGILDRIERRGYDVFNARVGLSGFQKIRLIVRSLWRFQVSGGTSSRR